MLSFHRNPNEYDQKVKEQLRQYENGINEMEYEMAAMRNALGIKPGDPQVRREPPKTKAEKSLPIEHKR